MRSIIKKIGLPIAMLWLPISASAYDFSAADIYYNITSAEQQTIEVTYRSTDYKSYQGIVTIPTEVQYNGKTYSVISIGQEAFRDSRELTSVTIPNSVTSIGNSAFYWCSGLTSVTIRNSVTSIGDGAFQYCFGLTSVTIPNSVTSIGNRAFADCSDLTSVTIPNSVTSIGVGAFNGCSKLTSVTIPASVTSIGSGAFYGCRGLTSVTIPNSVTSIGNSAFCVCSALKSVTIPNSVTSIGDHAFDGCDRLVEVRSFIKKPIGIDYYVFSDTSYKGTLRVPLGTKEKYKATQGWNYFMYIVEDETLSGVDEVTDTTDESAPMDVYSLQGMQVLRGASADAVNTLTPGLYIVRQGSRTSKIAVK